MELGELAADGERALRFALRDQLERGGQPSRGLERHERLLRLRQQLLALGAARGRKPTKRQRAAGSPEATSAVMTALAPGRTSSCSPSPTHARSSAWPGSEISGVPESLTSATTSPCAMRAISSRVRGELRCARGS